jgi:hypothetical protein
VEIAGCACAEVYVFSDTYGGRWMRREKGRKRKDDMKILNSKKKKINKIKIKKLKKI